MLRFALLLRFVTLLASVGAAFGAILMFWLGYAKLAGGMSFVFSPEETAARSVIAAVMEATDAFLFGSCSSSLLTGSLSASPSMFPALFGRSCRLGCEYKGSASSRTL